MQKEDELVDVEVAETAGGQHVVSTWGEIEGERILTAIDSDDPVEQAILQPDVAEIRHERSGYSHTRRWGSTRSGELRYRCELCGATSDAPSLDVRGTVTRAVEEIRLVTGVDAYAPKRGRKTEAEQQAWHLMAQTLAVLRQRGAKTSELACEFLPRSTVTRMLSAYKHRYPRITKPQREQLREIQKQIWFRNHLKSAHGIEAYARWAERKRSGFVTDPNDVLRAHPIGSKAVYDHDLKAYVELRDYDAKPAFRYVLRQKRGTTIDR